MIHQWKSSILMQMLYNIQKIVLKNVWMWYWYWVNLMFQEMNMIFWGFVCSLAIVASSLVLEAQSGEVPQSPDNWEIPPQ